MATENDTGLTTVDRDMLFDALADTDRRRVLAALLDAQTRTVDELARALAETDDPQADRRTADASMDGVDHYHIRLQHVHLPRLADAGLIRYDPDQSVVALTNSQACRAAVSICVDRDEQ